MSRQERLTAGIATGSSGAFGVDSAVTVSAGATLDVRTFANSVASLSNSGTLLSSATITTGTFTQTAAPAATTLNFPSTTVSPVGNVVATGAIALDGPLNVTSTGGFVGGPSTEVILFQSSGTGKQLTGALSTTTVPFGKVSYDYVANTVTLGASSTACDGNWAAPRMETGRRWATGLLACRDSAL
jgi:hypothetical protein